MRFKNRFAVKCASANIVKFFIHLIKHNRPTAHRLHRHQLCPCRNSLGICCICIRFKLMSDTLPYIIECVHTSLQFLVRQLYRRNFSRIFSYLSDSCSVVFRQAVSHRLCRLCGSFSGSSVLCNLSGVFCHISLIGCNLRCHIGHRLSVYRSAISAGLGGLCVACRYVLVGFGLLC